MKFFWMAVMDTLGMLCSSMSAPVVAGHIQTLLNQAGLPVTMAVSFFVLGSRFLPPQYIGSALIIGGKSAHASLGVNLWRILLRHCVTS